MEMIITIVWNAISTDKFLRAKVKIHIEEEKKLEITKIK